MDETTDRNSVAIERIVDAPVHRVWQMWTDPVRFATWYGPDGATVDVVAMDVSVGGLRQVRMAVMTPGGPHRMTFTGAHLEVVVDTRLVYTEAMADEDGNLLSPSEMGMPADHPMTTEVVVELEDLGARTRMLLTHRGVPSDSPGATGWTMAFDKLALRLADSGR